MEVRKWALLVNLNVNRRGTEPSPSSTSTFQLKPVSVIDEMKAVRIGSVLDTDFLKGSTSIQDMGVAAIEMWALSVFRCNLALNCNHVCTIAMELL